MNQTRHCVYVASPSFGSEGSDQSPPPRGILGRIGRAGKTALAIGAVLALAACASTRPEPVDEARPGLDLPSIPDYEPPQQDWQERPEYVVPQHMAGRIPTRVALLLPLGAEDPGVQHVAKSLRDAAELALFEIDSPDLLLVIQDTQGNAAGASRAARRALDQGAELIIGPLFAESVRSVTPMARERGVPVIAFSSDREVGGDGVYLLSFQVEEEIRRVVDFAAQNEMMSFAALVPKNAYGLRVQTALGDNVTAIGGQVQHLVAYNPYTDDFREPVKSIAEYGERKASLDEQIAELTALQDEVALAALQRLKDSETWGPVSYDAVLLPEGGTRLRSLAPMLPYYDIDNRTVRFMGTGLWDDPSLWREPSLQGGWFAAPPPDLRATFSAKFKGAFDYDPHRLASLAYDGVTLAAALGMGEVGERYTPERLENQGGFAGIDGIFRFLPNGATQRGLAVLQIQNGAVRVVGDAPSAFPAPQPDFDPYAPAVRDPMGRPADDPWSADRFDATDDDAWRTPPPSARSAPAAPTVRAADPYDPNAYDDGAFGTRTDGAGSPDWRDPDR